MFTDLNQYHPSTLKAGGWRGGGGSCNNTLKNRCHKKKNQY
jgi:hypothetical protein